MSELSFGGSWSRVKLEIVQKYLRAYMQIMKGKDYRVAYIDAFAGTGYQTFKKDTNLNEPMFPELAADEATNLEGSARIALQVEPKFDTYFFIEKDRKRFEELEKLKQEFSQLDIRPENREANEYIAELCKKNWQKNRAVLFLDPFGMQVSWRTIQSIASTKAIDLWYLFPLGIGVNRLLKKDGSIHETWQSKLDDIFGERNWENIFYKSTVETTLFGEEVQTKKVGDFASITQYFVNRLKTVFPFVAHNPLQLHNSRNNPLFLLCFASANSTAVKIAQDILKKY